MLPCGMKMMGCEPGGAGVGGHGGGRIAGGNAGHAAHAEPHGLGGAAGHAVVLERAGGVEALVLEDEAVEAGVFGGAGRVEQRRVALAQGDHAVVGVEERDHLAVAPDAALVERRVGRAALAPAFLQGGGVVVRGGIDGLQKAAAARAIVDDFGDGVARAAARFETDQFSGHEVTV